MVLGVTNSRDGLSFLRYDLSCVLTLDSPPNELLLLRLSPCGAGEAFDRGSPSDFGSIFAFKTSFPDPLEFERDVRPGLANPLDVVGICYR